LNRLYSWKALHDDGVFAASGTSFEIRDANGQTKVVAVANSIAVAPNETLRITPPVVDGQPQWYWSKNGSPVTAGVKAWVTPVGTQMPASEWTLLYEYNLTPTGVWWDLSAVDGLNANATMAYAGPGCSNKLDCGCDVPMPRMCMTNIAAYDGNNDGCPYVMSFDGANTCPNPKFYTTIDPNKNKPNWVVPRSEFTTEPVSSKHASIWQAAGSPSGADMALAPSGSPQIKPAYHLWWSNNVVGVGWLDYLQNNKAGPCHAYGWAYDEKKWAPGDGFDSHGNPPDNTTVGADVRCDFASDSYLNIDILKVM